MVVGGAVALTGVLATGPPTGGSSAAAVAAAATAPAPPSNVSAASDSYGLAVTVTWDAVAGAAHYRVYRSTDPATGAGEDAFLATAVTPSFRDDHGTAGRTLHYRIRAVDSTGASGEPSPAVGITVADGMADSRQRATDWLAGQQEPAQGFRTTFDADYPASHSGPVSGRVADVGQLPAAVSVPFVAFSTDYPASYVGGVSGRWANVTPAGDYRVDVYSRTDAEYPQGSFPLRTDGTWTSGSTIARAGTKIAYLVRRADGSRLARTGGPGRVVPGVSVKIYTHTDTDHLLAGVPLAADGSFSADGVRANGGQLIARLTKTTNDRVLNSTEWAGGAPYQGLVRSFTIPFDDPAYGYPAGAGRGNGYRPEQRSWIYDDALAVFAFVAGGAADRADRALRQLTALQRADGSLVFSYDVHRGTPYDEYVRSGALAWVGSAALAYEERTGDSSHRAFAGRIGDYLLGQQVTTANAPTGDPRLGSVRGGAGSYDADGDLQPGQIEWASTEHNIDAYFFLRDLGQRTGDARYSDAAAQVRQSLLTNHWNSAEGRFHQGVSTSGADTADAVDLASWGGLFLLAVGERGRAQQSLQYLERFRVAGATMATSSDPDAYNQTYTSAGPIDGYKPYDRGYADPPSTVWAEGSIGAALLKLRMGQDVTADLDSLRRLQAADPAGGFVQVTRGRAAAPYEFHVWPAVGGTAWAALLLTDSGLLWRPDGASGGLAAAGYAGGSARSAYPKP